METATHYDEALGIVRTVYGGASDVDLVLQNVDEMARVIDETGCGWVLVVIGDKLVYLSRADRHKLAESTKRMKVEREALVTPNPMLRMVVKAILFAAKVDFPIKFFKHEDEAIAWLQESAAA